MLDKRTPTHEFSMGRVVACEIIAECGINLSITRFCVKITQINEPNGLLHFPKICNTSCHCVHQEHGMLFMLIPQVRPARKYSISPWEMIHLPQEIAQ
jgi:hypothetical protein